MLRYYTRLQSLALILFLLLFATLSFNSRLATDDYYFIWDVQTNGVLSSVHSQYMEWCGRYAATLAMDWMYLFGLDQNWYVMIPFCSFLLLFSGIFFLFKVFNKKFKIELSFYFLLFLGLNFSALLYFLSFDFGETWFWYCSLSSYLWSIIAFVWLLVVLFSDYSGPISYFFLLVLATYIGGASEVYAVAYAFIIGLIFLYLKKQHSSLSDIFKDVLGRKILFVSIVFSIAFLIFLIAPGNYVRDNLFPERNIPDTFLITAKSIAKIVLFYLPNKLLYIVCFASPFFVLGYSSSKKILLLGTSFRSFFVRITVVFMVSVIVLLLVICYVMVETGPPRIMFIISFLFSIYLVVVSFVFGQTCAFREDRIKLFLWAAGLVSLVCVTYHLIIQTKITFEYSSAVDARIEQLMILKKENKSPSPVYLKPLPSAGMLYSTEISTNTSHFTNKELKLGLDLSFQVIKEEP